MNFEEIMEPDFVELQLNFEGECYLDVVKLQPTFEQEIDPNFLGLN